MREFVVTTGHAVVRAGQYVRVLVDNPADSERLLVFESHEWYNATPWFLWLEVVTNPTAFLPAANRLKPAARVLGSAVQAKSSFAWDARQEPVGGGSTDRSFPLPPGRVVDLLRGRFTNVLPPGTSAGMNLFIGPTPAVLKNRVDPPPEAADLYDFWYMGRLREEWQ